MEASSKSSLFGKEGGEKLVEPSKGKKGILRHLRIIVSNITGKPTVNGTKYTQALWDHILNDSTVQSLLKNKTLFGELDHPSDDETIETSLKNSAVVFTDLQVEDSEVMGEMDILDTPAGRIVNSLIEAGCNIGLSLRGQGTIAYDGTVSPQGYRLHGIDVVSNPSYQSSRLIGSINESVNTTKSNKRVILESAHNQINSASSAEELTNLSSVVNRLPIKESEKQSMISDINVKISDYENGDSVELTEDEMNDAILESVLTEVNSLQNQVTSLKKQLDESQQSYIDLVSNRVLESAEIEKNNVLVSKQDLRELKKYAKVLEAENEKLSIELNSTVNEHGKYCKDKEAELVKLQEEVNGFGIKVGSFDKLEVENSALKQTIAKLENEADDLGTAYKRLLDKYANTKQSSKGVKVSESFKTAEEFDRLFESAVKRNTVLRSSRPKNSFHSVLIDDMDIVSSSHNEEEEQFVSMARHFIPKEEK